MSEQPLASVPAPPVGLVPKFIRDEQRLAEIDAAIGRYVAALHPIPVEWLDERDALVSPVVLPKHTTRIEYGVERSFPSVRNGEPYVEWGASVGMSHRDEYTADSVHALAGGKPVYRRTRTTYRDVLGEPERFYRVDAEPTKEGQ
jgi:hypothetical protein